MDGKGATTSCPTLTMRRIFTSLVARLAALATVVTLAAIPAQAGLFAAKPGSLETAVLSKLPVATEHQGELWLLNNFLNTVGCIGCPKAFESTNGTRSINAYVFTLGPPFLQNFTPLPGGWEFRHVRGICLSSRLEARKIGSQEVGNLALLEKQRLWGFIDRMFSCLGGDSTVYLGIVANSRYLAFQTSEPGFVFFDLKEGKFLPWALTSDRQSSHMNLYVDQTGALYADEGFAPLSSRKLHRVVLGGLDLAAPLSKDAICEAHEIAKRIEPDSGTEYALGVDCN